MARNQEKKTPVIVVKKRRVISPQSVVDTTETVMPPVPEVAAPPAAADAQVVAPIPDASPAPAAVGKKKKGRPPRRPLRELWTREFTDQCMEKVKAIFQHLRAEGGGFLPLKVGISRDIPAWLSTLKPDSPGMNGTVPHPVSPPAVSICCVPLSPVPPAMTLTVNLPGRFLRMRQKMLNAGWPSGTDGGRKNRPLWPGLWAGRTQRQNDSAPGQENPSRSDR